VELALPSASEKGLDGAEADGEKTGDIQRQTTGLSDVSGGGRSSSKDLATE